MKAFVIYESMFGNTERIAEAIADGLCPAFEVTVADARTMPAVDGAGLIVIGGPTHAFGMSRPATREDAQHRGSVRPGAVDAGIREWLNRSPEIHGVAAAVFDTRVHTPLLAGSAARKANRRLRQLGCRTVVHPETFWVAGTTGPLITGEEDRARRWGAALAAAVGGHRQPA